MAEAALAARRSAEEIERAKEDCAEAIRRAEASGTAADWGAALRLATTEEDRLRVRIARLAGATRGAPLAGTADARSGRSRAGWSSAETAARRTVLEGER